MQKVDEQGSDAVVTTHTTNKTNKHSTTVISRQNPATMQWNTQQEEDTSGDSGSDIDIPCNTNRTLHNQASRTIHLVSFGYKHGQPGDTKHNFNIQKLPNPPNSLRKNRTGLDKQLQQALYGDPVVMDTCRSLVADIMKLIQGVHTV